MEDPDGLIEHMTEPEWGEEYTGVLRMMDQATARPDVDRLLDRMVGVWDLDGSWRIRTDRPPVAVAGRIENRWILFGRFLESETYPTDAATLPSSKVIYGYDPRAEDYFAFAVNALTRHYDIEHGHHDEAADALLLRGVEVVLPSRREIRYLRTLTFVGVDEIHTTITYPEEDDQENLGGISVVMRRRPAGEVGG